MIYTVKVAGRLFEVEIADLNTRPIVAFVDGEAIEVFPEDEEQTQPAARASISSGSKAEKPVLKSKRERPAAPETQSNGDSSARSVLAPIPGVIISILVKPGDEVSPSQELCVLEAMKMKNPIRSPRAGVIASVNVAPGQTVKHHDVLVEFDT
jgi:biotin carboxyl carrier protein